MKIKNGIISDVNIQGVEFKVDLIPQGRKRRPGYKLREQKYITIHNTGGNGVEADNYRRGQLDPTQDKYVSWHLTVGSKEIIQHIPINEVAWHAGTDAGNYTSFGIEVCEVEGAEQNAIKFVAQLLETLGWDKTRVRTHKSWSGKQCPWKILPHWDDFIENIVAEMGQSGKAITGLEEYAKVLNKVFDIAIEPWSTISEIDLKNVPALLAKLGGTVQLYKDGVISNEEMWEKGKYQEKHVASLIVKAANVYYPKWKGKANVDNLNVRTGAGISFPSTGTINKGKTFTVTGVSGDWYKINIDGKERFISSKYVVKA